MINGRKKLGRGGVRRDRERQREREREREYKREIAGSDFLVGMQEQD
jgi:hypothetical protein